MSRAIAAKRKRAPDPKQAIAIALSDIGSAKRVRAAHNWRHAMSTRTRTIFRRLFAKSN
jgi:hypothetical protein